MVQPYNIAIFESVSGRRQFLTVPTSAARATLVEYVTKTLGGVVYYDWYRLANSTAVTSAMTQTINLGGEVFNLPQA